MKNGIERRSFLKGIGVAIALPMMESLKAAPLPPVGSFAPNDFGLHDTMGNVWEWVRDRWVSYSLEPRPRDGERRTVERPTTNSLNGVIRGGSWLNKAHGCRVSNRYPYKEINQDGDTGFRPIFPIRVD